MPRHILSSLRWYAVNLWHWWLQRSRRSELRRSTDRGRTVVIDVQENRWHRYLHILLLFLADQGFSVVIRHRWRFIGSWASHDLFRRSSFFNLRFGSDRAEHELLITDRSAAGKHLRLDLEYFPLPGYVLPGIRVPMPMVDSQYIIGSLRTRLKVPAHMRRRAAFFFGNMDREAYARPEPREVFGCFTRTELFDLLRSQHEHRMNEPANVDRINSVPQKDVVLLGRHKQYIPPSELIDVLARFDFFLAPSGVVMPLCHNLVEAMFAGCIPILQHAHLMDPPLQNGIECLAFRDAGELALALERMRAMSDQEVLAMRLAVNQYCQEHLTPAAVISRLGRTGWNGPLHLNGELASVMRVQQRMRELGVAGPLPIPSTVQ
ncbi:MAG: glycosyltransferase [Flavobacteriales bacterium]|nr:glycosyltransferase [Flavobacteriales bacterium]